MNHEQTQTELPEKTRTDRLFAFCFYAAWTAVIVTDLALGWLIRWVRKNLN